ncbi:uncharacterized protein LOC129733770 [Wyeomyia smithii]|uniref:uncharacterized protein LOC129733770 n=1 Tax=Wyeomyia smithii TaxID=174621 RepID=UPI002467B890|nr:uncharacterized protein LOC129733770 [Wyeomyia smithii]
MKKSKKSTSSKRMERIEKTLADLATAMSFFQSNNKPSTVRENEQSWCVANTPSQEKSSVRWENIKPFPAGVPANKMWEEWNRYIENFEIAASLNNANDPVIRTRLLFLSMGPNLQEIVRAAKLRPNLADAGCYKTFISSINEYFKSMTDTAAKHEAFLRMRQETGETAVAFHARLMCKVRLCGYSDDDHDHFVRAQLLKGLRNKELVKSSRTYGYQTNYIVQAATHSEAYEVETVETVESSNTNVFQTRMLQKRKPLNESSNEPTQKRSFTERGTGRRSRCSRCNQLFHRNAQCPAINKNCNNCGKRGHFSAAYRNKRVNSIRYNQGNQESDQPTYDPPTDEQADEDNKQVQM